MNKRYLFDSHTFLWLVYKPQNISEATKESLATAAKIFLSTISLWELAIKHKKGRLKYSPKELLAISHQLGLEVLACAPPHAIAYMDIELPHKNPFDTMLIAQAKAEDLVLVTADRQLLNSDYPTLDVQA